MSHGLLYCQLYRTKITINENPIFYKYYQQSTPVKIDLCHGLAIPSKDVFKLNTDCSSYGNSKYSVTCGLIRDDCCKWVIGFACNIGVCTSIQVVLWTISTGLQLACEHPCLHFIVETDSLSSIQLIEKAFTEIHPLIDDYCALLNQD
ncbi:RVT_3 domain-containing protein [Cephalotus follicularis]|uniref:RVT_3 domain-containing protein n=1 Tax=Cephalotus follicularis TaxID=3775 RepID=A0A1Q3BMV3_CEPFO|nr:RVT_3 domain-containing protein [Cephalotus follicularis]